MSGIVVTTEAHSSEELERAVDIDISAFEEWFCGKVDTSTARLLNSERAILKTYLWYKTHSEK